MTGADYTLSLAMSGSRFPPKVPIVQRKFFVKTRFQIEYSSLLFAYPSSRAIMKMYEASLHRAASSV